MDDCKKLKILPTTIYEYEIPNAVWDKLLLLLPSLNFNELQNRNQTLSHGKSSLGKKSLHKEDSWEFFVDYVEKN